MATGTETLTVEQLVRVGGQLWEKGGKRRVYINDLADWYGLNLVRYHSGNISNAKLDGEPISNSRARKLATDLQLGRLWFDSADGQFHARGLSDSQVAKLSAAIRAAVAALPEEANGPSLEEKGSGTMAVETYRERLAREALVTPELLAERAELMRIARLMDEQPDSEEAQAIIAAKGWDKKPFYSPAMWASGERMTFDNRYPAVKFAARVPGDHS